MRLVLPNRRFLWILPLITLNLAQAAEPSPLTLSEAIRSALNNNPIIKKAIQKSEEAHTQLPIAISTILPTLNANGKAAYKKDSLLLSNALFGGEVYNLYSLGMEVNQPIYQYGSLGGAVAAAKKEDEIRTFEITIAKRDLGISVLKSFYSILVAERKLESLKKTESAQKEMLGRAEGRYRIGQEQQLDILQMRTRLALLRPEVFKAENQLKVAATELSNLISSSPLEGEREIRVTGTLDAVDWDRIEKKYSGDRKIPVEIEKAASATLQLEAKRRVLLSKHWPALSVFGNLDTSATKKTSLLDSEALSWALGLKLSIPIFSGLSSVYERRALDSQSAQLQTDETKLRSDFSLREIQAKRQIELSKLVIEASLTALTHARLAAKVAETNYRLKTANYLQLFEAQKNLLEAEASHDQARYDQRVAIAEYFVSMGWPLLDWLEENP